MCGSQIHKKKYKYKVCSKGGEICADHAPPSALECSLWWHHALVCLIEPPQSSNTNPIDYSPHGYRVFFLLQ